MTIEATYRDGAFYPTHPVSLPENTRVEVNVPAQAEALAPKSRVEFPLVTTGEPGSLHLTNDEVHQFLHQQDIEAVKVQGNVSS